MDLKPSCTRMKVNLNNNKKQKNLSHNIQTSRRRRRRRRISHNTQTSRRKRRRRRRMDLNTSSSPLCAKGCGFYGSAETKNFCSKCYKDYLKQDLAKSSQASASSFFNGLSTAQSSSSSKTTNSETASSTISGCGSLRVKNRCQCCNKKVGLTGFECRCGYVFCGVHRYPKEHSCDFDFKGADREVLAKENPVVKGDKLEWRI